MPSDGPRIQAQFFDGETAVTRAVEVTLGGSAIEIEDNAGRLARRWSYGGLTVVERPRPGAALRLKHESEPAARLIAPAAAADAIIARAPHLARRFHPGRAARIGLVVVLGVVAFFLAGYAILSLAPRTFAELMPESWRQRLGEQTEGSFIRGAKQCSDPAGADALAALSRRTVEGLQPPPTFSVRVYDMPIINAFALPGGRIVMTGKLISTAESPDEVAGVLAHELGHVAMRHPEAQLVRILGLNALLSIATGGAGPDTLGSLAGLLTLLRYTRAAEREADSFAQSVMEKSAIDPAGLRRFLERVRRLAGIELDGPLSTIGGMFATHPGVDERIAGLKPLPPGTALEVLPPAAWTDLKAICK